MKRKSTLTSSFVFVIVLVLPLLIFASLALGKTGTGEGVEEGKKILPVSSSLSATGSDVPVAIGETVAVKEALPTAVSPLAKPVISPATPKLAQPALVEPMRPRWDVKVDRVLTTADLFPVPVIEIPVVEKVQPKQVTEDLVSETADTVKALEEYLRDADQRRLLRDLEDQEDLREAGLVP